MNAKKKEPQAQPLTVEDMTAVFDGDEARASDFYRTCNAYGVKNTARSLLSVFINKKLTEDDAKRLLHRLLKEAGLRRPLNSRVPHA